MKTTTQVAVIGGGVVGCSVLYHLTKLGWSDVMLLERSELTSGSTWHAAGGFHTLNGDTNMAALQGYTIRLYKELEEITGMSCGLHHVGGVTLADNQDRFDMLLAERAKHRFMGLETEIVGPEDIRKIAPITNTEGIIGALYDPLDGHLDPSGTTHAYAKAARMGGATIETHCMVRETNQRPDGTWDVVTDTGIIHAEHVVNAGGLWAREVGAMAGVYFPLHPMEHQYLVTDSIPQIEAIIDAGGEHPHVMDPAGESYLRQEGRGLCIGFYEQPCKPWAVDGTPWEFGHELLPDDYDKITDSIEFAYKRFPVLAEAGVKSVIHGPFTFAPDGNPLVGPVPGMRNYWSACGVMAGFSQGGGVGLTLAQWMIEGEPERDVFAMDVARFGDWISPGYTRPKVIENYQKRFSVAYPNEELPAARPNRTTPMYDIFSDLGAVWGQQYGLEVPNYFAQDGEPGYETPSFRRSDAFDATGREVRAVRNGVGINEVHNFGKYRITGLAARAWLDRLMAGRVPQPGRVSLTPMLSPKGRLIGDFTVSCLSETEFRLTASYGAQAFHMRWFLQHQKDGVTIENVSDRLNGFQIAGPKAADVLAASTRGDTSDLRFLDVRRMTVGMTDCIVQRVSYTGDLGYEIYCDPMAQRQLWWTLWQAGQPHGMVPFGMRAMMSLRLDKFFGSWMREFSPDYTASETGLDRFIAFSKTADFIGRVAAEQERTQPTARKLVAFEVEADDADVNAYEPIWLGGKVVGFCTSGGYSHHAEKSIALGFLPTDRATDGLEVEIEILGQLRKAKVISEPLFDADRARMRDDTARIQRHGGGMTDIPILLLAAGQSSRMGGKDKLLQNVDGQPLLRRVATVACRAAPVIVALPPAPHPRHDVLDGLDLRRIDIRDSHEGMNASLRGALAHVSADARAAMVLLADLPDITTEDLTAVLGSVQSHPGKLIWRGAATSGKPGHPVVFDRSLFADLNRLTGDEGAKSVIRANADKVHLHTLPGQNALLDLDTPEDWAEWRAKRST